jgi:hypothetical protein
VRAKRRRNKAQTSVFSFKLGWSQISGDVSPGVRRDRRHSKLNSALQSSRALNTAGFQLGSSLSMFNGFSSVISQIQLMLFGSTTNLTANLRALASTTSFSVRWGPPAE